MKNLINILLLGIMLVNLMPYFKDGKVELKGAEVAAQTYLCESESWGNHKCVNTQDINDWFWGESHDCKIKSGQCICSECHNLFPCNGTSNQCGCGAGISKSMTIYGGTISSPSTKWCTFAIIAKIKTPNVVNINDTGTSTQLGGGGGIPVTSCESIAEDYFENVRDPRIYDHVVMETTKFDCKDLETFFPSKGISVNTGVARAEDLIDKMNDGSGCLFFTTYDGGHHMLGFKLSKSKNDPNCEATLYFYDPANIYTRLSLNYGDKSVQKKMGIEFLSNKMVK